MRRRITILAAATLLAAIGAGQALGGAPAGARAAAGLAPARDFAPRQVVVKFRGERFGRAVPLPAGAGVRRAAAALRRSPAVAYAQPDYIATASTFYPDDPGTLPPVEPGLPEGWAQKQWNFLPWEGPGTPSEPTSPGGIDAVGAWRNLIAGGRPGARGVTVAVLDTGIAYRNLGRYSKANPHLPKPGPRFRRSPDFSPKQFVPGFNFVEGNALPVDTNGHGTHVAGTIAEETDNGVGLTGLAYNSKLMPVQVLNSHGRGRAGEIAAGIRFAADHGAEVINMSFNFGCGRRVPAVGEAVRYAVHRGIVLVASVGNLGSETCISAPATFAGVIGVGGTTAGGCLGEYSLSGPGVDLVAPGGGPPISGCRSVLSAPIYQVTLKRHGSRSFGTPGNYVGTSMAAAHVSGVAAMVLAAPGVIVRGPKAPPVPTQVVTRLKETARSLNLSPLEQGAGLIDAARATEPSA
jgi:serine protease